MKKQVWFITGASKGLGLSLVKQLLSNGYYVAATSRRISDLEKAAGRKDDHFLPLSMNITDEKDVAKGIKETKDYFGQIDVVVNNAGYGQVGALEELSDEESRENFNVNVFGSLNVIRQVLPYLRNQGSGHILNIASIGGFVAEFPGFGIYCATKFAVHGLSESLSSELKPLGIKVTVVSPGYFRTNFLDGGSLSTPKNQIEGYDLVREAQNAHQSNINGNQPGDPDKAALAMIEVVKMAQPPLHLFLGQDAYDFAYRKIESIKKDLAAVQALATSTAFIEETELAKLN